MFFDKAIEKVRKMFVNNEQQMMQIYEQELHDATNEAFEMNIVVNKKITPCVCVDMKPGTDIDHVQELYEKCGIKLQKHLSRRGNRRQNILYIKSSDYAKLDGKHKLYFKRTTTNHKIYKQNLTYSVKKERCD